MCSGELRQGESPKITTQTNKYRTLPEFDSPLVSSLMRSLTAHKNNKTLATGRNSKFGRNREGLSKQGEVHGLTKQKQPSNSHLGNLMFQHVRDCECNIEHTTCLSDQHADACGSVSQVQIMRIVFMHRRTYRA
jgi:hypothetical protein